MRVELPSGGWVEMREKLMAADRFAVQDAITLTFTSDGRSQEVTAGLQNKMRNALLAQVITAWSFPGIPVPSHNPGGAAILGTVLDIDDYNHLAGAVQEMMDKVSFQPSPSQPAS